MTYFAVLRHIMTNTMTHDDHVSYRRGEHNPLTMRGLDGRQSAINYHLTESSGFSIAMHTIHSQ